jgi:hypothetical protein
MKTAVLLKRIEIGSERFEKVEKFMFLGTVIS